MNAFDDTIHRVMARHIKRAIPTRTSSGLSIDPEISIGIATIKIVTEEQIQAIAFGSLDGERRHWGLRTKRRKVMTSGESAPSPTLRRSQSSASRYVSVIAII